MEDMDALGTFDSSGAFMSVKVSLWLLVFTASPHVDISVTIVICFVDLP